MSSGNDRQAVEGPVWKFCIGLLAGVGLVFLPLAISAWPSSTKTDVSVEFPGAGGVILGACIALFIAAVTTVVEWHVAAKPWDTFVRALGIPALVMGSLTALGDAEKLRGLAERLDKSSDLVGEAEGISVIEEVQPDPVGSSRNGSSSYQSEATLYEASLGFGDTAILARGVVGVIGLNVRETQYLVVVGQAPSKTKAKAVLERIHSRGCSPTPVLHSRPVNDRFLILDSNIQRPKVEAQARVIAIKRRCKDLAPALLRVQP